MHYCPWVFSKYFTRICKHEDNFYLVWKTGQKFSTNIKYLELLKLPYIFPMGVSPSIFFIVRYMWLSVDRIRIRVATHFRVQTSRCLWRPVGSGVQDEGQVLLGPTDIGNYSGSLQCVSAFFILWFKSVVLSEKVQLKVNLIHIGKTDDFYWFVCIWFWCTQKHRLRIKITTQKNKHVLLLK